MLSRLRRLISNQLSRPSDVRPGTRVLDLGFGGGLTFGPLLERGATVVGVDRAEDMVAAAEARHRADVEAERITVNTAR